MSDTDVDAGASDIVVAGTGDIARGRLGLLFKGVSTRCNETKSWSSM